MTNKIEIVTPVKIKIVKPLTLMAMLFALPALCSAGIIGDFEGSLDGWGSTEAATDTVLETSTVGATVGTGSLTITNAVGGFVFAALRKNIASDAENRALLGGPDGAISIDVTADANNITGGLNLRLLVNGSTGGSEQGTVTAVTQDGNTHTMTFIPTANQQSIISNSDTWLNVGFSISGGAGPRTFHVDNIQVIPEPASLGLIGAGGSTMLFIRRRLTKK